MAVRGCRASETRLACIKTACVTVVFYGLTGASAAFTAGGFEAGSNLDFPEDTLEVCVILEGSHKVFVGKGKFFGEGIDGGCKVQVGIAVGCGGGGEGYWGFGGVVRRFLFEGIGIWKLVAGGGGCGLAPRAVFLGKE